MGKNMIHVENLTKYYSSLCAVDRISFDIQKGEILGLLGPNGAGKTTTLRMLTGFLRPTSGTICVKDYNIDQHSLEVKKLLGYLPESAPLYHEMLVYDYLDYVANIRELDRNQKLPRIRHLSDLCGLNEVMHQPIGELSKGFKQRVGLAHAMMNDPEILVVDEPTSGLDPNQIAEIRQIIRRIGKEKTVVLSTHILSEAEATCDRVVIINRGKIVADGKSVSGEYLINISLQNTDHESARKQLRSIDGILDIALVSEEDGIAHLRVTCDSSADLRAAIYRKIKETDWVLLELHQETKTLENVFRELTKEN
jgi:ABC-2 type transport system ATP-binding protein